MMIWGLRAYAAILIATGLPLAAGGGYLVALQGSPYYLIAGVGLILSGGLLWARRCEGALLYLAILFGTIAWGIWEAGADGWRLIPRLVGPVLLGLFLLIPGFRRLLHGRAFPRPLAIGLAAVAAVAIGAGLHTLRPVALDPIYQNGMTSIATRQAGQGADDNGDWAVWGQNAGGARFSPLSQITPDNVAGLKVAWTYRTGRDPKGQYPRLSVTPLKIDRTLYLCTGWNDIVALDAETGKERWRAKSGAMTDPYGSCRGVAYYRVPDATGSCATRIITNTVDARIIAVDARDGRRCQGFGKNGEVSLLPGMGHVPKSYYLVDSAPVIVRGRIILGGRVLDNQYWGEPSGVIRAYDAVTGVFSWAFDVGRPDRQSEPPAGETYTRSTPNSWAPMSADETLGLVYAPMGNPTPDYYGGQRRPFDETYSSATVAIDAATGKPRWVFQSTHHDIWDYDVSSQPTLADVPMADGRVRRLLVQGTKRGELFVLDRETGKPVHAVVERPAPQAGAVAGERLSRTQPFSVGMPSLAGPDLAESDMWGVSPLDQLWCRIAFKQARYDGKLTPPGLTPSLINPGTAGGSNWGSVTIDTDRHILLANATQMPMWVQLLTRAEADRRGIEVYDADGKKTFAGAGPQMGTPVAVDVRPFFSPLQVPCASPPYGTMSAIDLVSGKLIWTRPLGSAENSGPLGTRSHLPFTIGTASFGGSMATRSGITFIAASQDDHLRAFDTRTGKLLWDARLPAGGHSTPMSYRSPQSGRQFIAIAAAGFKTLNSTVGDYIIAYALPDEKGTGVSKERH
ncbi:membrane-bound PQQ-dependent dehydrogenase, glucose/quinate/shikimate family [Sphingobium amiense]|uniref:Membrane-bound PQQ-dependent dehydrogenase, glucose/quinate/shikimate family n=1 Tax=Sphingobium amiense TaxID=135719 RepID=A0A494WCR2_9SPHN|nr:membrane-bound PQQ-dependent dehydrogenase, glucose/quinate/shikimate family [Sphingobium amiense]BBD98412.1 membrane-bound PQQ-dependent dehydrogenase, glucose/quinate/shikimate family [Sphingobium amiense]